MTDSDLLREFVQKNHQAAYAELTRRHLHFVYAAARRHLSGDGHAAADITQQVFIDLAHKARYLVDHPCLTGWLYASTRFAAINTVRREQRRAIREREAHAMQLTETPAADWEILRPVIDDALAELSERDRELVLSRFFGQRTFAFLAEQCGVSENAAQKAVARALDLLNAALAKRGITSTGAALGLALAQGIEAAPEALCAKITAAAAATATIGAGHAVAVFSASKIAAALVAVAGTAIVGGYFVGAQHQIEADQRETQAIERHYAGQIQLVTDRLRAESRRAQLAESDTAALLRAIEQAKEERQERPLAPASTGTQTAISTSGGSRNPAPVPYLIRPGDTAARIAKAYDVALADLRTANPDVNWARLRVGQVVALPGGALIEPGTLKTAAGGASPSSYTVQSGDSLQRIVTVTGVPAQDLQRLNPGVDWWHLSAGQAVLLR